MLECFCKSGETRELLLEADTADPIWCRSCRCNLDMEDLSLSKELQIELETWASNYGTWINWEKDTLLSNAEKQVMMYNETGYRLLCKLQSELPSHYSIQFIPSTVEEYETL